MPSIHVRPDWWLPESAATPHAVWLDRRAFLRRAAAAGAGAVLLPALGCAAGEAREAAADGPMANTRPYPREHARNDAYALDRPLTAEEHATGFNNFYEFTTAKERVWPLAQELTIDPWSVEVAGLCKRKGTIPFEDIVAALPEEERLYRFRCVETWAMAVPWIGIPMRKFLDWVEPQSTAKYVRFLTFHRPEEAPGQRAGAYRDSFPYYEALRIDEAANELTLLATGIYGRTMPKQNGAPIRLIVPWKYGYKSAKSIVRIEFVEERPATFWNDLAPNEYGFVSNVDPSVPHPRWSQEYEWLIPDRSNRRRTLPYNGYAQQVAPLYE